MCVLFDKIVILRLGMIDNIFSIDYIAYWEVWQGYLTSYILCQLSDRISDLNKR